MEAAGGAAAAAASAIGAYEHDHDILVLDLEEADLRIPFQAGACCCPPFLIDSSVGRVQ